MRRGVLSLSEKPSDTAHALNQAIYEHVRDKRLTPPFPLTPADLPEPHAGEFARFLRIRGSDPQAGVVVTREMLLNVEAECAWQCRHNASSVWPRYGQVVYRGPDELAERIDYFLKHEDQRRELAGEMRQAVVERFTYDALVRAVLDSVGRALAGQGASLLPS